MVQHGLIVITPVLAGREEVLHALLNDIGTHIGEYDALPFEKLTKVHFMRWVILPAHEDPKAPIGPQLALSTNFDGEEHAHLRELATMARMGLLQIYQHCAGFPNGEAQVKDIVAYLQAHKVKNAAFYVGHVGRKVEQITQEYGLQQAIQSFLQADNPSQNWASQATAKIRANIVAHIQGLPSFQWAFQKYKPPFLYRFGKIVLGAGLALILAAFVLGFVLQPLLTGIVLALIILGVLAWLRALRVHEAQDAATFVPAPRDAARLADLNAREDFRIQNQITHLVEIKPGAFRQGTLRFILGAINLLAHTFYNRGNLAGIPSIHFARWAIIDNGRRLLFFSNFDGSWESYLGDFIDKAAIGLTGVWSNTVGFPATRKLIFEGARNSADFKAWVRQKQLETQVWYSAYKTLSVQNINNDTEIRAGMIGKMDETASLAWLQRL